MILSTIFLSLAVKTIPIGTAYIVWVGIGAIGAAVAGILLFKEEPSIIRLFFLVVATIGIAGLSLFGAKS